jgi:hypothetical protein
LTHPQNQLAQSPVLAFAPLLSDEEVAYILVITVECVRSHASEIPGFQRLGKYYRFRRQALEHWLGSLARMLLADQVAPLLKLEKSWVYANADEIPGVLRLGRYVRFRPTVVQQFSVDQRLANEPLRPHNEITAEASRKGC